MCTFVMSENNSKKIVRLQLRRYTPAEKTPCYEREPEEEWFRLPFFKCFIAVSCVTSTLLSGLPRISFVYVLFSISLLTPLARTSLPYVNRMERWAWEFATDFSIRTWSLFACQTWAAFVSLIQIETLTPYPCHIFLWVFIHL